jgi:zinc protease
MADKAQADIAYGFNTVSRSDPAYYALSVMNNILGQYALGGRLGDNIRERQGMAYYVFSAFEPNLGEGPLLIRAGVNPGNVERTIAAIDEEVRRMAADGVTAEELTASKKYLVGSMPRLLETNAAIASFLHSCEQFGLGMDHDVRLPGLLNAVTLEEVSACARRFLVPERAAITVAGPNEPSAA